MEWPATRNALADRLRAEAAANAARARAFAAEVSADLLAFAPPAGGWSPGQVFEHLCVADESYLERIRPLVADPQAPRAEGRSIPFRPTLGGRLLVWGLDGPRRLKAPKIYKPAPAPRPGVIEEHVRRVEEIAGLLDRATGLDWRRIGMVSPVTPLIRPNLGDAFTILIHHTARHHGQIERLREEAAAR